MYPTVSDLIYALFGFSINLQIPTYSFFLFLTFCSGAFIIYLELKRKEKEGLIQPHIKKVLNGKPASLQELLIIGFKGFLVGYKIVGMCLYYYSNKGNPGHYIFSFEGNWWGGIIFALLFVFWLYQSKQREKLEQPIWIDRKIYPHQLVGNIFVLGVVFGIVGAKLFNIFEDLNALILDPWGTIFSLSGLNFHGGFVLAVFVLIYYVNRKKIGWINFTDVAAPGLMLGYAVARVGCHLSGDGCWGIDNMNPKPAWLGFLPDWMWASHFPHNSLGMGIPIDNCTGDYCKILENTVYPTSFYEIIICVLLFIILWSIRKKIKIPGILFSIYLILNGTERIFIELIRINPKLSFLGIQFSQAQIVSFFLVLFGVFGIFFFKQKNTKPETSNLKSIT